MNAETLRGLLGEVDAERARCQQRDSALLKLKNDIEALLELEASDDGAGARAVQHVTTESQTPGRRYPTKRRTRSATGISLRRTVLELLQQAAGRGMHVDELLRDARARGADTTAKRPESVMDLIVHGLERDGHAVKRVAPRTWAWVGDGSDQPSLLSVTNGLQD